MKNLSIRSTLVLSILGSLSILLLIVVEWTQHHQTQAHFQQKMEAARLMQESLDYLKTTHFKNEVAVDNINDPNDSRIIGERYSSITSGRGSLPVKLSTVNPNFAAMMVDLFKKANLKAGDHIAVGATGSFPALNIAVATAAEVMQLKVTTIASVTSSSWGANHPDYTYLDIHKSLQKGGFLSQEMLAASIGANQDIGRTISPEGRAQAATAIHRNGLEFINGQSLVENIDRRMDLFAQSAAHKGLPIDLYVNVGGGVASLGSTANSEGLTAGLLEDVKLDEFIDKRGVMFEMASRGVALLNLRNLTPLMREYGLPLDPVPLPLPGEGTMFYDLKYDLRYVTGATLLLVLLIFGVILYDKKQNALGNEIVQPAH
ncbi:MAG: poly-gamma-glutamate system protein [Salibacteraceae bacterium]